MTGHLLLQSQTSLCWVQISASHMNFNDSFVNFLDMRHLTPSARWVINQQPALWFHSLVLTSAVSHSVAARWRLSTRLMGMKTTQISLEHPWFSMCAAHAELHKQGGICFTQIWIIMQGTQTSQLIFETFSISTSAVWASYHALLWLSASRFPALLWLCLLLL